MDKLSRLKWIPMLVRAYSDARVQRELELRSAAMSGETEDTSVHTEKKVKKTTTAGRSRRMSSPGKPASHRRMSKNYRSVLLELQETKQKLQRLEVIHRQLNQMQKSLDARLADVLKRLEGPEDTEASNGEKSPANEKPM